MLHASESGGGEWGAVCALGSVAPGGAQRRWVMVGGGADLDWGGVKKAGRTARNFGVVALGR